MHLIPCQTRVPDIARRLPPQLIADVSRARPPGNGDLALAEVLGHGASGMIDLVSGRSAGLYQGDTLWVCVGRYEAPLALSCNTPDRWGEAALVGRSGVAGAVTVRGPGAGQPTPLRLLGQAVDARGEAVTLARLTLPMRDAPRPLTTVAVVSCARGSRSALVAASLVRGFHRIGLRAGVAKPVGVIDAGERWGFLDAGALAALDLSDCGILSASGLSAGTLADLSRRMLGQLAGAGAEAAVLRVAGGMAVSEVADLLQSRPFAGLCDGVVLAAADALSATEGARQLRELGLPLIAVSGAIARSPLASREAAQTQSCPVLPVADLAQPATLHRVLSNTLRRAPLPQPALRLVA